MKYTADLLLRHRFLVLAVLIALTVLFGYHRSQLQVEKESSNMLARDDPELEAYRRFLDRFETEEFFIVTFRTEDVFTPEILGLIQRLTDSIKGIPYVRKVTSLTNVTDVRASGDSIEIGPLIQEIPEDPAALAELRRRALGNEVFLNNVVSRDGKTAAIVATVESVEQDAGFRREITRQVEDIVSKEAGSGVQFYLGGGPIFWRRLAAPFFTGPQTGNHLRY